MKRQVYSIGFTKTNLTRKKLASDRARGWMGVENTIRSLRDIRGYDFEAQAAETLASLSSRSHESRLL